jgi:Contractile injection system tube protein
MTAPPIAPRLLRGGLVLVDADSGALQRIIALQYNPDTLTRSFQVKGTGTEGGDRSEALRLKGPAVETLKLEVELDATDRLAAADRQATRLGLQPELATLELLVHPTSRQLAANAVLATRGELEIVPTRTPLALFVWGPNRVAPVRVTDLSITEEAFDVALNPIRAKVSLGLRVLSVDDLGFTTRGGGLFMSYLSRKEQLSASARAGTFAVLGITGVP